MIIWGGAAAESYDLRGGRYNPQTNSWTQTATANAPPPRKYQTAVWTGAEMIVWGGYYYDGNYNFFNAGGRYNPAANSWTSTSVTRAPSARYGHAAVWTGAEMIVWGGYFYDGRTNFFNTGGRYNPPTDSWVPTATGHAPSPRQYQAAVWSGTEMIIWGGGYAGQYLGTGGRYDPARQLSEGLHHFEVRATDAAGNTDPSSENYDWLIELAP
jgi:N-acetylneuraminic acid mutarotase